MLSRILGTRQNFGFHDGGFRLKSPTTDFPLHFVCDNLGFFKLSVMEMGTAGDSEASPLVRLQSLGVSDTRGKHRVQAELKRLEQEARSLEVSLVWNCSF